MSTSNQKVPDIKSVIVVGVDFSESTPEVIRTATSFAGNSEVHLVHVLPVPPGQNLGKARADRELRFADKLESARGSLDRVAAEMNGQVKRVVGHLRVGPPDVEIAQVASDVRADLIVVGTHGYRGLDRLLLGSVAESLVRHAPCPVLTFRRKVTPVWDQIEPPCPDCLAVQEATNRAKFWCERHLQHHARAHTYSEIPPTYGMGAQTFRMSENG